MKPQKPLGRKASRILAPNQFSTPNALGETRRDFLKKTIAGAAGVAAGGNLLRAASGPANDDAQISILLDGSEGLLREPPAIWAVEQLRDVLNARGVRCEVIELSRPSAGPAAQNPHPLVTRTVARLTEVPMRKDYLLVTRSGSALGAEVLSSAHLNVPDAREALGLTRARLEKRPVLLACGSDARGLLYALLDLVDKLELADKPLLALKGLQPTVEKPANTIRSIARSFVSDVEDKGWFNDRSFWRRYLTTLAAQRFNRFSLTLGIGYDFTTGIRDCYFHFAYPFLVSPPGYNVRAVPLPTDEPARNLDMLRFISEETARRGMHFQLGLWTHAYQWINSPRANHTIEGLSAPTHAPYCRDALHALLMACPAISGVTFRIHGESGVAEGSYDFWRTVFAGLKDCGRPVEIDMHAKGIDQAMIDVALETGMPVNVSPKFWAEHMGLPYMQGAIRPIEAARPGPPRSSEGEFFSRSSGTRKFLRYGYGDLLAEGRRYGVLHRIWPGTQRLLLWGDPDTAAEYGRVFSFCGSAGVELCEPLSFKGRKGSGSAGGRTAYADASLRSGADDFEKYLYTYRVWGRKIYNPDADIEGCQRLLNNQFGAGARRVQLALQQASRILPLVTTAHCPSAANNNYWPELYTNMPVVSPSRPHPYSDTLSPKKFGAVSSLDPEFFSRIDDFADELLRQKESGRYSPAWVADWLESTAGRVQQNLLQAEASARDPRSAAFRRVAADVAIQAGLGQFFAWKLRAGVYFALYERSAYRPALEHAIGAYRKARAAWAELGRAALGVYVPDITFGYDRHLRGHWSDRLPAIDDDIADMQKLLVSAGAAEAAAPQKAKSEVIEQAIRAVTASARPEPAIVLSGVHTPPAKFERGQRLTLEVFPGRARPQPSVSSVQLRYRRVNQAEAWQVKEMEPDSIRFHTTILASYTDSPFPLQYHFELRSPSGAVWLYPGFQGGRFSQPYFVLSSS